MESEARPLIDLTRPVSPRKPEWLKVKLASGENYERLKRDVKALDLHTVCQEAMCPNIGECWGAGTATIMILGDTCTRACKFCNVKTGSARGEVDWLEPKRVAEAVRDLGWKYLVLTAVDRDDLRAPQLGDEPGKHRPVALVDRPDPDLRLVHSAIMATGWPGSSCRAERGQSRVRKKARRSAPRRSGASRAAKWPPRLNSDQRTTW